MNEETRKRMASSVNDKWQTPLEVLKAVFNILGVIDLDPASPGADKTVVEAGHYFTEADNGLVQPWQARTVYLNPPYGRTIGQWTRKLSAEYETGNTMEFVTLLPARVDTRWWDNFVTHDMIVCFIDHRLKFLNAEYAEEDPAMFPSALIYGPGKHSRRETAFTHFERETASLGGCWTRYRG